MRTLLVVLAVTMLVPYALAARDDMSDPGIQQGRDNGTDQYGLSNNWQGFYNTRGHNGGSPTLDSWVSGDTLSNAVLAAYTRQDLADAIAESDTAYGASGWTARILLTPPTWVTWPNDVRIVVGAFTCNDPAFNWNSLQMTSTRMDRIYYPDNTYSNVPWPGSNNFEGMVNAQVPTGDAVVQVNGIFTMPENYNSPIAHWKFATTVPQQWFRDYAAGKYTGFFASNTGVTPASHYNGNQWGHGSGYMDLEILPEPATMSLLIVGGLATLIRRKR